uniref:Uncharacterized protein n=1 Tax=Tanacetum cinerariifolium TaxID=118510 RepID=A0A6L2NA99_TANCI|nr:hypothetical protein [Tanacetum cinerariifolium]
MQSEIVLHRLIMMNLSFDLNVPKDSSNTNEAAQNGGTPKSVTFEIHYGGCFTSTPSRSYVGGQDNKIILVYVEHGSSNVDSSIFVTLNKGDAIVVDNHLRKATIEIDSSPDVNRNLTSMCHRNLLYLNTRSTSNQTPKPNTTTRKPHSAVYTKKPQGRIEQVAQRNKMKKQEKY